MEILSLLDANKPEKVKAALNQLIAYFNRAAEIPNITKESLGLDMVDNTRDLDKPLSVAQQEYIDRQNVKDVKLVSDTKQIINSDIEIANGKKLFATRGDGSSVEWNNIQNDEGFESLDLGNEDLALRLFHSLIDINGINVGRNPKVVIKDDNGVKSVENIAYKSDIQAAIAELINSAPETLDTLNEIATAITGNKSLIESINAAIANKVSKEDGKGLSANDYTDEDKAKVQEVLTSVQIQTMIDNSIENAVTRALGGSY